MPKIVAAFVRAEVRQALAEERPERLGAATASGANEGLELGEAALDGIEVRAVGWPVPEGGDEFLKEWEAKERPLNTRFVRLTTRRLCQQADWWEADIPGRKEQPDYWTKDKVFWNLNQRGIVMARRIIREKRRESIKWYAEVWGPFAPLIWGGPSEDSSER